MTAVFTAHSDLIVHGGPVRHFRSGDHGPPVLLLHGGMLDTAEGVWRDVAHRLAAEYQVH
ncbi:MAG: alpha/beta hydrolase, partial [Nocardia sp.]|nr:alpha/beta hydrolase [Nocardia sp.]